MVLTVIAVQVTSGFVGGDVMARWWNNQAIKLYERQQLGEAIDRLKSAKEYATGTAQTVLNNLGSVQYEQGVYQSAVDDLEAAVAKCDGMTANEECARGLYNLGNSHYRLGEQAEGDDQRSLWEQAIADYKKALEQNPNDTQAQENIEFIKEKLAEQQNDDSEAQGQEGQDQEAGDKQDQGQESQESASPGSDGQSEGEQQKGEANDQENSGIESGGAEQSGSQSPQPQVSARAQQQQPLSNQQQAQLEQYMQQMDANQQRMGQYFRQSPDQQEAPEQQNPLGGLFNDPFFSSFFGNPLGKQQFRESNGTGQPDW